MYSARFVRLWLEARLEDCTIPQQECSREWQGVGVGDGRACHEERGELHNDFVAGVRINYRQSQAKPRRQWDKFDGDNPAKRKPRKHGGGGSAVGIQVVMTRCAS